MSIRFRYRDRDGKEVAVPGLDELRVEIREGRVRDATPLFDADTGIFAPASDHAPYRLLAEIVANGGSGAPTLLPMEMTLTEAPKPDPAEALEELRKELAREAEAKGETVRVDRYNPTLRDWEGEGEERAPGDAGRRDAAPPAGGERAAAADARPSPASSGSGTSDAATAAAAGAAGSGAAPSDTGRSPGPAPSGGTAPAAVGGSVATTPEPDVELPTFVRGAPRARPAPPGPHPGRPPRRLRGLVGTAAAALVALTLIAGLWAVMSDGSLPRTADALPMPAFDGGAGSDAGLAAGVPGEERAADPAALPAVNAPDGENVVPSPGAVPLAATEGAAFRHMVQGIDSLARLFAVGEPPAVWLEGRYLAEADAYPDVAAYWERYLGFADAVREESELLFRRGFVRELEEQGVSAAVVSLRVADALPRFRDEARAREEVFQRMTALGRKALTLHDLLVLRSDELTYDPMAGSAVAGDAFLQVAVEDDDLRKSIWRLMDGIFDELGALHGEDRWSRDDLARGMVRGGLTR